MFRCGPDAKGTHADYLTNERGEALQDWPKPWWIECDRCGRVMPYHDGGWQVDRKTNQHVCVPPCNENQSALF